MPTIDEFMQIDIRVGKILKVEDPPTDVKKPVYVLTIDFGPEVGQKVSFSGIRAHYQADELIGKLVLGVVNLPPRKIGSGISEVLTLGAADQDGNVILVTPETDVPLGERIQ